MGPQAEACATGSRGGHRLKACATGSRGKGNSSAAKAERQGSLMSDLKVRPSKVGQMKRRKKKVLDVGTEARRAARKSGLVPGAMRVIEDKRKRPSKHRK